MRKPPICEQKWFSRTCFDKERSIIQKEKNGKEDETGTLKLDPDKKPKTIDFDITSGKDKGKKQLGIYKLEDDSFTLCIGFPGETERPAKFESEKGSKTALAVMKREKK